MDPTLKKTLVDHLKKSKEHEKKLGAITDYLDTVEQGFSIESSSFKRMPSQEELEIKSQTDRTLGLIKKAIKSLG